MRKMISTLSVFALICAMAVSANAANFWGDADSWWFNADSAGVLTFQDNKNTFTFDVVAGDNFLGLQRGYVGHDFADKQVFTFVPAVTPSIDVGFIGYYFNEDNVLSTSFYWVTLNQGEFFDWAEIDAAYAGWVADGGLVPDRSLWQTSGFASFFFEDYAELGFDDFTLGQLEGYYQAFYVDPGCILPVVIEPEPVDDSVVVGWCEHCEGNDAAHSCGGIGCDGTGKGPNGGGNQQ